MNMPIQASIAAALENRRGQREHIEQLHRTWLTLSGSIDTMLGAVTDASGRLGLGESLTPEQLTVTGEPRLEKSEAEIRELRQAVSALAPDIEAINRRVHRETVNIGVIGRTQAGKSTLLRTITGLGPETIPSTDLNPTTAARSRMFHSPGRADADITLLTWPEFRDSYLEPLHRQAGRDDPVPASPDEFLHYPYTRLLEAHRGRRGDSESGLIEQKYLNRLCVAQESFDSYRDLLTGSERTLHIEQLRELRPYVAYPENDKDLRRPYHAVRDVRIYCAFPGVDVENLVLVDLPGAGEAGLDIDRQFLRDLKNEVDVLLQIKRPTEGHAFFDETDWDVLRLADAARMGVAAADFVSVVINSDPSHVTPAMLDNAAAKAREVVERNSLPLLVGNAADTAEVREDIFGPVLRGLAEHLAQMDLAAAGAVLTQARGLAERAINLADWLADMARRREERVPDEEKALRTEAKRLRNTIAKELSDLRSQYDLQVRDAEPVPEVSDSITMARDRLMKWADSGFGAGSHRHWLALIEPAMIADPGETRDDQCTLLRQELREEFSQVDGSLASAVGRLHQAVATILQTRLSTHLVPEGASPLNALLATAQQHRLETLSAALEELIQFPTSYGSIFLRVGRPIVRQITPRHGQIPGEHGMSAPGEPGMSAPGEDQMGSRAAKVGRSLYAGARKGVTAAGTAGGHPAVVVGVAGAQVAAELAPIFAEWIWQEQITDDSADGLHEVLYKAFRQAVERIDERMRDEAGRLTEVLAAVVDQFFDQFARSPGVEEEFARLCWPIRQVLWPATFDGRAAAVAAALRQVADAASASGEAARAVLASASSADRRASGPRSG
jgi:energy-coupling factor transporter ATP-binding protein EcfA2